MSFSHQLPLPFPPIDATDPPFLPAPSNADARAWLASAWPDGRLVLCGATGFGKSHLLRDTAARTGATLWHGDALGDVLRPPSPLLIDDADRAPEPALLHLLNAARETGARVLLAMRNPPTHAPIALPDLASRLRACAVATLDPPEDTLLEAILVSACAARQLAVPQGVQDFLRLRLPRTGGAMREAAARLDRAAMAAGRTVTRPLAAEVLAAMGVEAVDDSADPLRYAGPSLLGEAPHDPR